MSKIRLVLLSCCAPCSAGAIVQLKEQDADFCVLFYNPNIFPESEYQKRLTEQVRLCEESGVKYAIGNWAHDEWLSCIRGLENEPERGGRCAACFRHRFGFARKFALENGYNSIASVFGVSRHKDRAQVDFAAAGTLSDVNYISIEWDEFLRQKIIKKAGFYRQNYCGCEFSTKAEKQ